MRVDANGAPAREVPRQLERVVSRVLPPIVAAIGGERPDSHESVLQILGAAAARFQIAEAADDGLAGGMRTESGGMTRKRDTVSKMDSDS